MPNPRKDFGGVSNHFYGLARYLPKDQIRFCYTGGLKKINMIIAAPVYIYQYLLFIYKIARYKPDIINLNPSLDYHAVVRDGILLLISKVVKKKVVIFWHGWKDDFEVKIEKKYLKHFKSVYQRADLFIVLSTDAKKKLIRWGFNQPICLTTTKVDDFLIRKFDIKNKKPTFTVLFLGRLEKTKGIYETLRAFQLSQKKYPDLSLTYAGTGSEENKLREIIEKERIKNVYIKGFVKDDEKIQVLMSAGIFILPSYTEGMPTSLLEAMAFGIPIVTRPVGAIPDFFIEGKMGYLVESKEPIDFAEKIDLLYSDKKNWNDISRYNYNHAVTNFLASRVAKEIMTFYYKAFNDAS
jgi:glycosyltransferase involved in cell wall biosynthesis